MINQLDLGNIKFMFQTTNQIENQYIFQGIYPQNIAKNMENTVDGCLSSILSLGFQPSETGGVGFRNHPPYHLKNECYVVVYSFKSVLNLIYIISHKWYHGKYDIGSYMIVPINIIVVDQ